MPLLALLLFGCARYQTPGAGVAIGDLSQSSKDIVGIFEREPTARFPARIALARIQATGYESRTNVCHGRGQFCVVTTRDVETEDSMERLQQLPMMAGLAPMNRMLLPSHLHSMEDLRTAAATLRADLLLTYTLDTKFSVETRDIGPLAMIGLGFLPTRKAKVSTTASAALFDVRSGYLYGVAEATATEAQRANAWGTRDAIDAARLRTEADAYTSLVDEFRTLWIQLVKSHDAPSSPPHPKSQPTQSRALVNSFSQGV